MKRTRKAIPVRIDKIEFIRVPYDGPEAVEQRLDALIEVAIDVGIKEGLFQNSKGMESLRDYMRRKREHKIVKFPLRER